MILAWWRRAVRRFIASSSPGLARRSGRHFCRPSLDSFEQRLLLSTFLVTNTNDSGPGSLRQVILDADRSPGKNTIEFHIGAGGLQTIAPTSVLPAIIYPVYLDGTTQPGFAGSPLIVLSGKNAGPGTSGLVIEGGSSTVMGLVINGFQANGLWLQDKGNDLIVGNYLGTDATGTVAIGNQTGLFATAPSNTIGGTALGSGNLISGNPVGGVVVFADGNFVQGNRIGTDVKGSAALPNGYGVYLSGSNITVGGNTASAGNLISGNMAAGVEIFGATARGNQVLGNRIGTDISGKASLGNQTGVLVSAPGNTIGGTAAGARNLISGNRGDGIVLAGAGISVQGNFVGTDITGVLCLGNSIGLSISGAESTIGGMAPGAGNVISGNRGGGLRLLAGAHDDLVQGNYIGTDLTGTRAQANGDGVLVIGSNNTIGGTTPGAGNLISGNNAGGISIGGQGNIVQGNRIGTDATGEAKLQNGEGVVIGGSNNTVGGTTPGARNLISGNVNINVELEGNSNLVQGNYIGTDTFGKLALGTFGVYITGSHNMLGGTAVGAGNLISGNGGWGVDISGRANTVQGNFIGTDATGTAPLGNWDGIDVNGSSNLIGGSDRGAGNVISGNVIGLEVIVGDNQVQGNLIGTDASGTVALGNRIGLTVAGPNDTIGGTIPGAGNVISGNQQDGIFIAQFGTRTQVQGNLIGTDITGMKPLGNSGNGVYVRESDNTIGGTTPGAANVISSNGQNGIYIAPFCSMTQVQGNLIGTDITGTSPLSNGGNGIYLNWSDNTIGGLAAGAANTIAFNGQDAVLVDGTVRNAILSNTIHSSTHLGIELINGGNNNQPFPVLTMAVSDGSTLTFQGSLSCAPTTTYRVQFFANSVSNPSGFGDGERFLGSFTVTTDSMGSASFMATFVTALPVGHYLSATATDPHNNTSQFSQCVQVAAPQDPGGPSTAPHRMLIRDMLFSRTWDGSSLHSVLPVTATSSERSPDLLFRILAEDPGHYTSPPYRRQVRSGAHKGESVPAIGGRNEEKVSGILTPFLG